MDDERDWLAGKADGVARRERKTVDTENWDMHLKKGQYAVCLDPELWMPWVHVHKDCLFKYCFICDLGEKNTSIDLSYMYVGGDLFWLFPSH